jgi:hypothetical protein
MQAKKTIITTIFTIIILSILVASANVYINDGSNGLSSNITVINNNDGTYLWEFYYSNGTNYANFTTSNLTGIQGLQGINGTNGVDGSNGTSVTISSAFDNGDGTFTWYFSTGYNFTTSNLTGAQGVQGTPGTDAYNITNNITNNYTTQATDYSILLDAQYNLTNIVGLSGLFTIPYQNITNPPWLTGSANLSSQGTAGYIPLFNSNIIVNNSAIYQSGNSIGIGTTAPNFTLHVIGNINATDGLYSSNGLYVTGTISLPTGSIDGGDIADSTIKEVDLNATNLPVNRQILAYNSTNGGFYWVTAATGTGNVSSTAASGYIPQMQTNTLLNSSNIYQLGNSIGIGTTAPNFTLHVIGNINATDGLYSSNGLYVKGTTIFGLLTAASCDVKSYTNGTLYCGTDATGSGSSMTLYPINGTNTISTIATTLNIFSLNITANKIYDLDCDLFAISGATTTGTRINTTCTTTTNPLTVNLTLAGATSATAMSTVNMNGCGGAGIATTGVTSATIPTAIVLKGKISGNTTTNSILNITFGAEVAASTTLAEGSSCRLYQLN